MGVGDYFGGVLGEGAGMFLGKYWLLRIRGNKSPFPITVSLACKLVSALYHLPRKILAPSYKGGSDPPSTFRVCLAFKLASMFCHFALFATLHAAWWLGGGEAHSSESMAWDFGGP